MLPILPRLIEQFDLTDYDLVISSSTCVAKGAIPRPGTPHICYCNSPMRYVWDLYDIYRRESGALARLAMPLFRRRLQKWDVRTCDRVTHFIANSRNIAAKIRRFYNRDSEVVHPPVDCDFYRPGAAPPGDYYFACSAMVPYKRLDVAIEACGRAGRPLVVAGSGPQRARLERLAAQAAPGLVEFIPGWVSEERLRALYCGCRAFLFPGEEDFGITPLEAMACGRPVIAYRKGGVLETVIEGQTGLFFDAQTPESMAAAIARFETMTFDPAAARAQAQTFSRPLCCQRLFEMIEKLSTSLK